MNRPIKFRAWDGKRMLFSESGDFYLMPNNKVDIPSSTGHEFYRKDYPIMQFTGLHDRNGREIYEGDLIRHDGDHVCKVIFQRGAFRQHYIKGTESGIIRNLSFSAQFSEIIGNIYETP